MAKRVNLATTVAPETIEKLKVVTDKYSSTQGRIVDKAVDILHRMVTAGRLLCCDGRPCIAGRTDVPDTF